MSVSTSPGEVRGVDLRQGPIQCRERGAKGGPTIVLVHGILANGDGWRYVVPELTNAYRCITPDWPLGSHACRCATEPTSR